MRSFLVKSSTLFHLRRVPQFSPARSPNPYHSTSIVRNLCSGVNYTAPPDDGSSSALTERLYGPDKEITPLSRKPVPEKLRTRNEAGPYEASGRPIPNYPKRKSPFKRTTALIDALTSEEALRMIRDGRANFAAKLPRPEPGHILRITYKNAKFKTSAHDKKEDIRDSNLLHFTGIVIASRQRLLGSTVILRNVINGIAIERAFPLYSPLIENVEVVGKKRVIRNKLYYLRDKPLRDSTVSNPLS